MAGLERRGNKQKQAEQLKQGRGENVHVAIDWRAKKSQNPIKARITSADNCFSARCWTPRWPRTTADNKVSVLMRFYVQYPSADIRGQQNS